jgi:transposase
VEVYAAVRRFVFVDGSSRREAARVFGLSRETVGKMCRFSLPPGYTRKSPAAKPKLGPLLPVIDAILEADLTAPVKQRHTAKRIFERLRDEHGFAGGYTVVKDHVRVARARGRETFVPLAHPPGHGQVDFGEAVGVIGGVRQKIHFFCLDLAQSDACFVKAFRARRPRRSLMVMSRASPSSAVCRCRSSTIISRSQWRRSAVTGSASGHGPSPSWSAITCLPTASAVRARGTTRSPASARPAASIIPAICCGC